MIARNRIESWAACLVGALLTLALPVVALGASPSVDTTSLLPAGTTSWIVTLRPGSDPDREAPGLARAAGGSAGFTYQHALSGFAFEGSPTAAAALLRNPRVRTVAADGRVEAVADFIPTGVRRIRADHASQPSASGSGFTGAGMRVAIIDTGIDLTHPDLAANIDADLGRNCIVGGSPQDDNGHGTHVAGTVAAADNGSGLIGVAPDARLVPIKVLDHEGSGSYSSVICAIDYLTGLATDEDPGNDVRVANMSFGIFSSVGTCTDGSIREAICRSTSAGIVYVAAAGNSAADASSYVPAAYPEVIAVSALTDLDGEPGGLAGCFGGGYWCDDTLAAFSNFGTVVDVTAPGDQIESTWLGGGYLTASGTSMAAPHAAGVAAIALAENASLSPAQVGALLEATGECPNQQAANLTGDCLGKGQWTDDPDGTAEPLVNALRAAQEANPLPSVHITDPIYGTTVDGNVVITATADDDDNVTSVEFLVNDGHLATDVDGSDGWSALWASDSVAEGTYNLSAVATDSASHVASDSVMVSTISTSTSGATYVPLIPARLLDTRFGTGLSGPFQSGVPRTFQVTGLGGVPADATAVTGNLTVTAATAGYAVFLGPNPTASPTTSTINFVAGDNVANGVTVALGAGGTLSATYLSSPGNTTALVFDVTGYFVP